MGSAHQIPEQPSISTVIFSGYPATWRKPLGSEKRLISQVSPGGLTAESAVDSVPSAVHEICFALADAPFFWDQSADSIAAGADAQPWFTICGTSGAPELLKVRPFAKASVAFSFSSSFSIRSPS